MKKILEVKEFDKITGNPDYKEDSNYKYLEEPAFQNLIDFIKEYVASDNNDDAFDCFKVITQRGSGDLVITKNYVGLIQMKNGYQVEILPKISMGGVDDTNNRVTKSTFIKMLRCMDDFQSKVFSSANLNIDRMNLYEIFINMYLQELNSLVKKGLKSTYITEEDNLSSFKGKLIIKDQIIKSITHKEKFSVVFDEYQINRPENQLIKSTLLKLNKITERIENKKNISQLLTYFERVDESINYVSDFSKVIIDRTMTDYDLLLKWSRIFLMNKSFTTFSGETVSRSLLFPMDKLFEGYVSKNMKKIFAEYNWKVSTQDKGYYLFNEPNDQFALRPDIVVTKQDGTLVIMDTKWKSLNNNARENYNISQADMYQMYAYARKYEKANNGIIPEVWMLYPLNDEVRNHDQISYTSGDGVKVHIYFIDLTDIKMSIEKLKIYLIEGTQ